MPEQRSPENYSDAAAAYFLRGYNCAQSTAAAFAEDFGLDPALLLRMTAGFGGGMGGLRQTCGAVSAMALVAGLRLGAYPPDDVAAKTALYDLVKRMHAEFVRRHGSACCRELLERAGVSPDAQPSERDAEYYARRPCPSLVASAAEIIAGTLPRR
jgi:C_GCAxxG_C_C family probable redox protein